MGGAAIDTHTRGETKPLLFLSHAGDDSAAAAELKRRIEQSEEARQAGLSVWLDTNHLGGGAWQEQLEAGIAQSTAFAVYIGRHGVVNWVEAEVRAALDRANKDKSYPFIPIFASKEVDLDVLPMFARRFQGMPSPEQPEQVKKLIGWILDKPPDSVRLESEPFFGLKAIDEGRDHLFFGREKETADLVDKVRRFPLVLVSGDSGSGKSSLVRAGLVPRFRGRALIAPEEDPQRQIIYHAVVTRPSVDPWRLLGESVTRVAAQMGCSPLDQETYAGFARNRSDFEQVRHGLRCHLDPELTRILLVVDQFEELFTLTPEDERAPFVRFLLSLVSPADPRFRVVLTMRHDYVNLITAFPELAALLDADDRGARYVLGRMSDEGLREIVCRPLALAGIDDESEREALANAVLRDVGQRPGDLALVQMALTETWRLRGQYHGDLLQAYSESGRVEGALAKAAETFLQNLASDEERSVLDNSLIRLIRIGETGGATRRIATRDEFDAEEWSILQRLASAEGKRLVFIGGGQEMPTAEISHEALVTAWPHFQNLLHGCGPDKLVLDELTPRAKNWIKNKRSGRYLANGADLEMFARLAANRKGWLSRAESEFVAASAGRERAKKLLVAALVVAILATSGGAFWKGYESNRRGEINKSQALADRALAVAQTNPEEGVLYAYDGFGEVRTSQAENALRRLLTASLVRMRLDHPASVRTVAFDGDGKRLVTTSGNKAYIWDNETGNALGDPLDHGGAQVLAAAFSPTSNLVITGATDGRARLWRQNAARNWEPFKELLHGKTVLAVALSPDDRLAATGGADGRALVWDVASETVLRTLAHSSVAADGVAEEWAVTSVEFDQDAKRLITASGNFGWLWDIPAEGEVKVDKFPHRDITVSASLRTNGGEHLMTAGGNWLSLWDPSRIGHLSQFPLLSNFHTDEIIRSAAFNRSGSIVVAALGNGAVQVRQAISGVALRQLVGHGDNINSVALSPDGAFAATASDDHTARLWSTKPEDLSPLTTTVPAENRLGKATFSPRSPPGELYLAIATDWDATIWDAISGHRAVVPLPADPNREAATETITFNAAGEIADVEFDSTGERVATASPNGAAIWSLGERRQLMQLWRDEGTLGARFNRVGDRLLTWGANSVAIWDVSATAAPDGAAPLEPQPMQEANFDAGVITASFVTGGADVAVVTASHLVLWNPERDPQRHEKRETPQVTTEASFNCAGDSGIEPCASTVVATVGDGTVTVRKLAGSDWQLALQHPAAHAALSADGTLVAAMDSNRAEVLSVETGKRVQKMHTKKNRREMLVAAFSPDDRLLATGRSRGWADIWVVETGERATRFQDEPQDIASVSFSPQMRFLMTANARTARVHRRERFETVDKLLEMVPQRTTEQARREYLEKVKDEE